MPEFHTADTDADGRVVYFGRHVVPIRDIVARRWEQVEERDSLGAFANALAYFLGATALAIAIIDFGWDMRLLIAVAFLLAIGLSGLIDVAAAGKVTYYRLVVTVRSGETLTYATADPVDVERFERATASA